MVLYRLNIALPFFWSNEFPELRISTVVDICLLSVLNQMKVGTNLDVTCQKVGHDSY